MAERDSFPKFSFFERRRRIRRPRPLLLFGSVFLILPFVNYLVIAEELLIPPSSFFFLLSKIDMMARVLLFAPILVGLGLLLVKRWGWYLFLAFSLVLIIRNIFVLLQSPGFYNVWALGLTAIGLAAVFYFVRKDVSAPYMKMYPRGWRLQKRKPVELEVIVDGIRRKGLDAGDAGVYVEWLECYRDPGEEVQLTLRLNGEELSCRAGIVRTDESGVGIAYRGISRDFSRKVRQGLATLA